MKDTLTILREISLRLREASDEYEQVCAEMATAEEGLAKARLYARARAMVDHPKARVADIEMYVEMDGAVEPLRHAHGELEWRLKALKDRMHTDRQVLSAWQSHGRIEADLAR